MKDGSYIVEYLVNDATGVLCTTSMTCVSARPLHGHNRNGCDDTVRNNESETCRGFGKEWKRASSAICVDKALEE